MTLDLPPSNQILEYALSFEAEGQGPRIQELRSYFTRALSRAMDTLRLIPRLPGHVRVLELAAEPYFMTILIKKYLGYDVATTNFHGDYGQSNQGEGQVTLTSTRFREPRDRPLSFP
jgi:hypothetical protein